MNKVRIRLTSCLLACCLLLSNLPQIGMTAKATELETVSESTTNVDKNTICYFDFENENDFDDAVGLPSDWTWEDDNKRCDTEIAVDEENPRNHVLKLALDNEALGYKVKANAVYVFSETAVNAAILEYRIYVEPASGTNTYLLSFKRAASMFTNPNMWVGTDGKLYCADGDGFKAIRAFSGWHTVKIAANFETKLYDLYIDGELTLSQRKLNTADPATHLVAGIDYEKGSGAVYYDDITVMKYTTLTEITSFKLEPSTICVGEKATAQVVVAPETASVDDLTFTSSNEAVATVAEDGTVTGVAAGKATITAACGLSIVKTAVVTVKEVNGNLYSEYQFENESEFNTELNLPSNWVWADAGKVFSSKVVADPDDAENHVYQVSLEDDSLGKNVSACAVHTFSEEAVGSAVIEYRVCVKDGSGTNIYLPSFKQAGKLSYNPIMWIGTDGKLYCSDGTGFKAVQALQGWHTVKLAADFEKRAYDLYIDGNLVLSQRKLNVSEKPTQYMLGINYEKAAGGAYFDDITVSKLVPVTEFVSYALSSTNIYVNQVAKATVKVEPANASFRPLTFESSNPTVAEVDSLGNVTGKKAGEATITASCVVNGEIVKKSVTVTVVKAVASFVEDFENSGAAAKWTATGMSNVKFEITDDYVNDGNHALLFETYRSANYNWTAYTKKGINYRYPLTINGTEETASLTKAVLKYRLKVDRCVDKNSGDGYLFLPNFMTAAGIKPVELCSNLSTIRVATAYDQKYIVKSIGTDEWYDIEWMVDLENAVYDLYIDGELIVSNAEIVSTQSSNGAYAVVYDDDGQYVSLGQQKITRKSDPITQIDMGIYANTDGGMMIDDLMVLDYEAATAWRLADDQITEVAVGNTLKLNMEFTTESGLEASCRSAKITSSDTSVAVVDYNGNIVGKHAGTTTITIAPNEKGLEPQTITVTVKDEIPVTGIDGLEDISLPVGGHQYINGAIAPSNASAQTLSYKSSNESVAFVDEWGEVWARTAGSATITVSAGSFQKTISVTVNEPGVMKTYNVTDVSSLMSTLESISQIDKSTMTGNIVVNIAPGYYQLTDTLKLDDSHGGNGEYSVIYRGSGNVTIGGGIRISGSSFTKGANGIYEVNVPAGTRTRQLFVDNVRAVRARSERIETDITRLKENGQNVGVITDNVEIASFKNQNAVELVFSHAICGLDHAVATDNGKVKLYLDMPGCTYTIDRLGESVDVASYFRYYENALELLDEPGEWYLDETANKLYYMPRAFEDMSKVTVTIPAVDGLMTVEGSDYAHMAQNISFEGITFADATWMRPSSTSGHSYGQNNAISEYGSQLDRRTMPDGSVMVKCANGVTFKECTFTRLGSTALYITDGVQNFDITGNHFFDVSANALAIGDVAYGSWHVNPINNFNPRDIRRINKNINVTNNYIHNTGETYFNSCALSLGFAANVNITNNEIFDVSYSAMHIGYGWNAVFENVQKNVKITHNFIHNYLNEHYDGGAVYTIGNSGASAEKPNEVAYNYMTDIRDAYSPLYPDNGSTFWRLHHNVCDMSQLEAYPYNGEKPAWLLVNEWTHDIWVDNNYTTTEKVMLGVNHRYNTYLDEATNKVYADANWPEAAQKIIRESGLNLANAASLRNNQAEVIKTNLPELMELDLGQSFETKLQFSDGKGNVIAAEKVAVHFAVDDSNIATVDAQGNVKGCANGTTVLHVYVISNNVLHEITCPVYVGAQLAEIQLRDTVDGVYTMVNITAKQLEVYGVTDLGNEVELAGLTYAVEDETIATVSANGKIKPLKPGETTLTITKTIGEQAITGVFTLKITDAGENVVAYGTPVLDGKLDDVYLRSKKIDLGEVFTPAGGTSDTEGYCYLAWDEENLYVYTYVAEECVMSKGMDYLNANSNAYANDCIETYIKTTLNATSGAMSKFACDAFGIKMYGDTTSATNEIMAKRKVATAFTYNGGVIEGYTVSNPSTNMCAGTDEQPVNGYVIEMTIPIALEMGITDGIPKAGDQITFQIQINDTDLKDDNTTSFVARKNTAAQYWLLPGEESDEPTEDEQVRIIAEGATVTPPANGWAEGINTFTVKSSNACVVLVSNDNGATYTVLKATATDAENTYSFTAKNVTANTKIVVALKGDANGDGKLTVADRMLLNRALQNSESSTELDAIAKYTCDLNGDGTVTVADRLTLNRALVDADNIAYAAPTWDE